MEYKCVQCPFFKRTKNTSIVCEGFEEETSLQLNFLVPGMRNAYMDAFCNTEKCWQGCELYQLIAERYKENAAQTG